MTIQKENFPAYGDLESTANFAPEGIQRAKNLCPTFTFRALTLAEHEALNPKDGDTPSTPGRDTQLFRNDPRTISEVFADWEQFEPQREQDTLERHIQEAIAELEEYCAQYNKARKDGNRPLMDQYRSGIVILVDSLKGSQQTAITDTELIQIVDEINREPAKAA